MNVQIEVSWKTHLQPEFEKDYFRTLTEFVKSEYSQYQIFPPGKLIFNAFNLCPFDKVKVVIIGQDPYHGPGQAHGLCFSVPEGIEQPPSVIKWGRRLLTQDKKTNGSLLYIESYVHRPPPAPQTEASSNDGGLQRYEFSQNAATRRFASSMRLVSISSR